MPTSAIKNSIIRNVTWKEGFLTVEFKTGSRYRYTGVNIARYYEICGTETPGKYYMNNIKGKYSSEKLKQGQA